MAEWVPPAHWIPVLQRFHSRVIGRWMAGLLRGERAAGGSPASRRHAHRAPAIARPSGAASSAASAPVLSPGPGPCTVA